MKILEAKIEFEKDGELKKVAVLVDFAQEDIKPFSDVRAMVTYTRPTYGYTVITPYDQVNMELIKRVAGKGIPEDDTIEFQGWKKRHLKK